MKTVQMSQNVGKSFVVLTRIMRNRIVLRRKALWVWSLLCATQMLRAAVGEQQTSSPPIEQLEKWGLIEVALPGPTQGNPFVDVQLSANFRKGDVEHKV